MLIRFLDGKKGPTITIRETGARYLYFKIHVLGEWSEYFTWAKVYQGSKFEKWISFRRRRYIYLWICATNNKWHIAWRDYQLPTKNFYFDPHHFFFPHAPDQIKKKFKPSNNRFSNKELQQAFKQDGLITNEESEIKKKLFRLDKKTKFITRHFFQLWLQCNCQTIVVTALNRFPTNLLLC